MKRRDKDFATGKLVDFSKPEEAVRQDYERILHRDLGYPKERMDIEVPIQMGSSSKQCDIAVYDDKRRIIGIIEIKAPKKPNGVDQLKSYMSATPTCRWGVATNSDELIFVTRNIKTGEVQSDIACSVPRYGENEAIIKQYEDLQKASNLKWTFRLINNALYANTNLARTEKQGAEMVRLIFCKLQDEYDIRGNTTLPSFQVKPNESAKETRKRINELWKKVKSGWVGASIFSSAEVIEIDDYSLRRIISELQGYSLLKTERDVVGDAFEIFSERQFAGEKGQFFTPRPVVKMVIDMINPQKNEKIIDPACGSGGFLIAALYHITQDVKNEGEKKQIAEHCLYGIDKDNDLAKICKAHMSIIGDGKSNILRANSLESPKDWDDKAKDKLLENGELKKFDVVITNPPFGTNIKVEHKHVLCNYDLGHKWKRIGDNWEKTTVTVPTPPQVLFIELCIRLLKPNGRLGIVLPDGLLGNPGDGYIRQWIEEQATILAVVDCPTATFMPHTGTKTSVIIIRKKPYDTEKIFFAVAENCGHTMRGKEIYTSSKEIREDFTAIAKNYLEEHPNKHLGFYRKTLSDGILVPRYYDPRIRGEIKKLERNGDFDMVPIAQLEEDNQLRVSGISASVSSEDYDLHGTVRFIRTSDISCFELYERTQKMASEQSYLEHYENQDLQIGDILFVKDGDDKIGETVILLDDEDCHILVQTHFKKIRPLKINQFLLLWQLNTPIVKKQIRQRVFNQSTLSTIGNRIYELCLPVPRQKQKQNAIINSVKDSVCKRRQYLQKLRDTIKIGD